MPTIDLEDVLSCRALPTLPSVAAELLRLTDDPNVKLEEIERLVVSDVGLSSRILRTINSSLYSLSTPCTSIKRAMAYLGLNAVKSLVLGFSMVDLSSDLEESEGFGFREYWRRVIYGAAGARFVATATECCDPDEAFTAAMFQDMGMVATLIALRDRYGHIVAEVSADHERLPVVEQLALGFNHAQVGAELASRWGLPAVLAAVIRHHHLPADTPQAILPMVRCLALGRFAAASLQCEVSGSRLADLLVRAEVWFPGVRMDANVMLDRISAAAIDVASVLGQQVGPPPPVAEILAEANKQLFKQQLIAQRELLEAQQREQVLRAAAVTDKLTGITNRAGFDAEVEHRWEDWTASGRAVSVLFVDVDKFKPVNDTYGHQVGDRILQQIAARLTALCDGAALPCRYGGEEFAIVLTGARHEQAVAFAERVRDTVASAPFVLADMDGAPDQISITVSVGVATVDGTAPVASSTELVRFADEGVYAAKDAGRNCVRSGGSHAGDVPQHGEAAAATEPGDPVEQGVVLRIEREILFVDDDAFARVLVRTLLTRTQGIDRVRTAATATAAIELLREEHAKGCMPMAVVCDMELRERSALDVMHAVREMAGFEHLPFIVITANPTPEIRDICLEAGAHSVYSKDVLCRDLTAFTRELKQFGDAAVALAG